jgi:tetratricopeptide (TPR) repeat protein
VAFVVEDLQWSDDGLLDFLEHLLDWGRSSPIFVLTLARPELLERRPGWGTDRRGAIAMRLDPLAAAAMRELLEGIAPDLPGPVVDRILERADGLPLYAVETIRMLVATGRLAQEGGRVVMTGRGLDPNDPAAFEVPPTLHALVAARLDRLSAADRSILQDAAVLGQTFTIESLAAISGETTAALESRLDTLVRQEILTVETDPRAPTRGQHAFVQALVREVAYGTLSKRDRRARHLTAARHLESLGDDELAGVVASHFVAAYRAAPDGPAGEAVAAQARVSLLATADRAEALGALGQAIDALTSALEVTRDPSDHARLLERVGMLQGYRSRYDEGHRSLAAAVDAYTALGDQVGVIRAIGRQILLYLSSSQIATAMEVARPFRDAAEALATRDRSSPSADGLDAEEADAAAALFIEALARTAFRGQEMTEAVRLSDRAMALAEPLRLDEIVAMSLVTKGTALMFGDRRREGLALLEGAVLDARAHGAHTAALRGLNNLASGMVDTDPRGSLERTREGMALARRLGLTGFDGYHAGNAVGAAERLGEWAWAEQALGELVENDPDRYEAEWIAANRDSFTAWRGDPDIARAERILAAARAEADFQSEVNASTWLARCAFAAGRPAEAVRHAEPFLRYEGGTRGGDFAMIARFALHAGRVDVAQRLRDASGPIFGGVIDHDVSSVRAGIAALEGRIPEALGLYRSALTGYRDTGCRFDFALTVLDMATLIGTGEPAVRAAIPEGREILVALGAHPLVERLDGLANGGRRPSTPAADTSPAERTTARPAG